MVRFVAKMDKDEIDMRRDFEKLGVPAEFVHAVDSELRSIAFQRKRNGGVMPENNVVYASVVNLRKLYIQIKNGRNS